MLSQTFRFAVVKTLIFSLALAVAPRGFAQNGLSWSAPEPVAAASFGVASPRLALLPGGEAIVVWGKTDATPQIWCARWNGNAFETPVQIGTGGITPGLYEFGGLDVATAGQRVFVVFENFDQGIYLARSDDGGASWQPPVTVFGTPPGMANTISAVAVDAAGNPLVSFLLQTSAETDAHVELARSTDGGLTFPASANASVPADDGQTCECCYQDILPAGNDTVFVAFRANRDNLRDMWVTRSTDGGNAFDTACDADAQDWIVSACPFSGPRLTRLGGDSLLAVWMSKGSGNLRVYASTLHGGTMIKGIEIGFPGSGVAPLYNQNRPDAAGQRDTVAVVWEETGFANTGQDLVCAFSTTGAGGLAANIAPLPIILAQKFPQLAYADGVFHLLFVNGTQGLAYCQGTVMAASGAGEALVMNKAARLSPNPVGDFLRLDAGSPAARVEIWSATGTPARAGRMEPGELFVGDLAAGVYFLKISGKEGGGIEVLKFLKQ